MWVINNSLVGTNWHQNVRVPDGHKHPCSRDGVLEPGTTHWGILTRTPVLPTAVLGSFLKSNNNKLNENEASGNFSFFYF